MRKGCFLVNNNKKRVHFGDFQNLSFTVASTFVPSAIPGSTIICAINWSESRAEINTSKLPLLTLGLGWNIVSRIYRIGHLVLSLVMYLLKTQNRNDCSILWSEWSERSVSTVHHQTSFGIANIPLKTVVLTICQGAFIPTTAKITTWGMQRHKLTPWMQ